mgnify:CR=1 FL=1
MNPIFIIGTERSGTNLLRLMLNVHPNIAVPHPPHIIKFFSPLIHLYGDLKKEKNFRSLAHDVCKMVDLHPYKWPFKINREKVILNCTEKNLSCIYFAVYNQYLEHTNKKRWACKSTFMIDRVDEILQYYPDAKFIYMVRDGRDVAVSAKKSIFNDYHVYYTANRWKSEQQQGIKLLNALPPLSIFLLKYEELVKDTKNSLEKLCSFLDEKFDDTMLQYHQSAEARISGSLSASWKNTGKPVINENIGKYSGELSKKEIDIFETIAYEELGVLGYTLVNSPDSLNMRNKVMKKKTSYYLSDRIQAFKVQLRHLIRDKNNLRRFRKYWFLKLIPVKRIIF